MSIKRERERENVGQQQSEAISESNHCQSINGGTIVYSIIPICMLYVLFIIAYSHLVSEGENCFSMTP